MTNISKLNLPAFADQHRYLAIFYGVILLVWLTTESAHVLLTTLLGLGLALLIVVLSALYRLGGHSYRTRFWLPAFAIGGTLTGLLTAFTTFMLMLFKNVQHAHLYPDFPNSVMFGIVSRAPMWALAGGLIGTALALARIAKGEQA